MIVFPCILSWEEMSESPVFKSSSPLIGPDVLPGTVIPVESAILFIVDHGVFTPAQLLISSHRTDADAETIGRNEGPSLFHAG